MSLPRGFRFVLGLLVGAVVLSAAAVGALYLTVGRGPRVAPASTLVLRPSGELPEVTPELALPLTDPSVRTVRGYVEIIRKARHDRRVTRLLLKPGTLTSPFWAGVQELREAVLDFKASGKPVDALLEGAGPQEYLLATAADRVFLVPGAVLDLTGLASYEVFLRGTFDWIGTYPDFLRIGDFKTAVNVFTERTFTPAHREMSASLNRDQFDQLVRMIADGRRRPESDIRALVDRGPFPAEEALRLGLVDELAYEDELDDLDGAARAPFVEAGAYAGVSWASLGVRPQARIALINAAGTIVSGRSGFDPVNGSLLGSESLVEAIRAARASGARALVLRIDSPGGSSIASDVIWRELMISKSASLPLVVSMSDLAASGGYYLAMAGDVIVAHPGTLTGSIGVYTGKFVTGGTFEKLGANIEAVSEGRHAEMYSPDRPFTDSERARVLESIQATYDVFVERVAAARGRTPEEIDQVAQGRVWTGHQARDVGLVDELGGLRVALAAAKARAGIPPEEEVLVDVYPRPRTFYDVISAQLAAPERAPASTEALLGLLGPRDRRILAAMLAPSRLFRAGELLALMPYVFVR